MLNEAYVDVFFKRAIGEMPEMESSKAAARRLDVLLRCGDRLLDVGCGAGHYLRSINRQVSRPFYYCGLDASPYCIDRARKAFGGDATAKFVVGDLFAIDATSSAFDIVMCNNVLQGLESIVRPLGELCRVARRHVLARMLVSSKSYVVKDVDPASDGADFNDDGSPMNFSFINIYGEAYIRHVLAKSPRVARVTFEHDIDFRPDSVADTGAALPAAWNATRAARGVQFTGPILLPWCWIDIELSDSTSAEEPGS